MTNAKQHHTRVTKVRRTHGRSGYEAHCSCGWMASATRATYTESDNDASDHVLAAQEGT